MFQRVTIVGVGLLGASLGLALKERKLAQRVVGVGRKGSASLEVAVARGAIDEAGFEVGMAVEESDLVVLCTPVRQFPEMFKQMGRRLKPSAIVTDVGSTKGRVMEWARDFFPAVAGKPVFVGSHPMAGSEKRGPEFARGDLYEGAVCLLCAAQDAGGAPSQVTLPALNKIDAFWRALGMKTVRLSAEVHDQWVAGVSHLPHAVAFSLVNAVGRNPEMMQAAAGGFLDTTRIAASDGEMWTDIFMTNREAVLGAIDGFSGELAALRAAIAAGDEAALRAFLSAAKKLRDEVVTLKSRD